MTDPSSRWTAQVRESAVNLIEHAARCRREADRALAYFLRTGIAHGLTLDELTDASGLSRADVLRITDPAAAGT